MVIPLTSVTCADTWRETWQVTNVVQVYHSHNMTSIHDRCLSNIPVMRTLLYREAIYKFHLVWFCKTSELLDIMPMFCVMFSLSEKKPRLLLTGPREAGKAS